MQGQYQQASSEANDPKAYLTQNCFLGQCDKQDSKATAPFWAHGLINASTIFYARNDTFDYCGEVNNGGIILHLRKPFVFGLHFAE